MTAPAALSAVDEPDELAELTRSLPAQAGRRRLEAVLSIEGVHCAGCVLKIEHALRDVVEEVAINVLTRRARLIFSPDALLFSALLQRIEHVGYTPRPLARDAVALSQAGARRRSAWQMLLAVFCMMQVMMYAWPRYVAAPGEMTPDGRQLLVWAEWVLTLPVLLLAAGPFFRRAWHDLRARRLGMDVPVALGIAVTFVASSVGAATQGEVWFDSLTMFVAFLLIGRWLEARARERAILGLTDLMAALPQTVERRGADGTFVAVTLRHIQRGDWVRVAAGQALPADGTLGSDQAQLDEALLTGESTPCLRRAGDTVRAGSINLDGPLLLHVTHRPRDSRLAQIAALVEHAALSKPPLAQLADAWAQRFTVVVLALAGLAAAAWSVIDPSQAAWVAASVLIVTCPCALSLATPAAMLAASANLARQGMLLRRPQTLETLATADTVVFDKTGTLTLPHLQLLNITCHPHPLAPSQDEVRALAAAVAAGSTHPVAQALLQAQPSTASHYAVRAVQEHRGQGLSGEVLYQGQWRAVRLGHADFIHDTTAAPRAPGVWLSVDHQPCACLTLQETLRSDALTTLNALRTAALKCVLLSGDHHDKVQALARHLNIEYAYGQASPEDKLAQVRALQAQGHRVVMVGDGINDAPVLAQADCSITFAHSATLAQCHADMLILHERLGPLLAARTLAQKTRRIVRQNLTFAAAYNMACVPLALMGMMPPWLAGLGMAGSSLLVVLNALRLTPHAPSA